MKRKSLFISSIDVERESKKKQHLKTETKFQSYRRFTKSEKGDGKISIITNRIPY